MTIRLPVRAAWARFAHQNSGNSIIETALILPVLLLLLAGAVDIGRLFQASMVVNTAARTGAAYGIHHPTDVTGMVTAAQTDIASLITSPGKTQTNALAINTPTAISGCQCSDGTNAVASCTSTPSCAYNSVYYVQVSVSATYTPIMPWPGIPSTIALSSKVRLRAAQ